MYFTRHYITFYFLILLFCGASANIEKAQPKKIADTANEKNTAPLKDDVNSGTYLVIPNWIPNSDLDIHIYEYDENPLTVVVACLIDKKTDKIIGKIIFNCNRDNQFGYIEQLLIEPEYRKQQLGSMLLNFALSTLTHCECKQINWIASPFALKDGEERMSMLPKLVAFYKRHGAQLIHQNESFAQMVYFPKLKPWWKKVLSYLPYFKRK